MLQRQKILGFRKNNQRKWTTAIQKLLKPSNKETNPDARVKTKEKNKNKREQK